MDHYKQEIELYFELKEAPESSQESYLRRILAFMDFIQDNRHKRLEDIEIRDIQQYILHLKNDKGLSAETINNYISSVRLFYSLILDKEWTQQAKASRDNMGCRTAALGGNASECEECGYFIVHYNSCRNRHCPKCQGINRAILVDKRSKDILNAPYFYVVFTMPQELQSLIYQKRELLYGLMYKAVAETLSELSQDKNT